MSAKRKPTSKPEAKAPVVVQPSKPERDKPPIAEVAVDPPKCIRCSVACVPLYPPKVWTCPNCGVNVVKR